MKNRPIIQFNRLNELELKTHYDEIIEFMDYPKGTSIRFKSVIFTKIDVNVVSMALLCQPKESRRQTVPDYDSWFGYVIRPCKENGLDISYFGHLRRHSPDNDSIEPTTTRTLPYYYQDWIAHLSETRRIYQLEINKEILKNKIDRL